MRFQRRDAAGQFTDAITDAADRPSLATLESDYAAPQAAHSAGADRTRVTTRAFDAAKGKMGVRYKLPLSEMASMGCGGTKLVVGSAS
ncbi:MAG: hypothetical protein B7Y42_12770 [Polaromonas sp. 28-63-22]|nr:MAG: hypothetical protein B7Y42_12770 [Polaromonas sp. 28-63-22]